MAPIKIFNQKDYFHHIKKREYPFKGYETDTEYQQESRHVINSLNELRLHNRNRQVKHLRTNV